MSGTITLRGSNELFDLTTFLEGRTTACGVFEDRFGNVRRRFTVDLFGRWQDRLFVLEERFTYEDGTRETRVWRVTPMDDGKFTATSDDCIGLAHGACDADSIRMSYRFRLKLEAREIAVNLHDRFYRVGDRWAVNRATMSKWGIRLGEVSLFFRREEALDSRASSPERFVA